MWFRCRFWWNKENKCIGLVIRPKEIKDDIAIFIANFFFSKTRGIDIEGMNKFINEYYYANENLKEKEGNLIKEYALEWINYILSGNEFDTSTTESFEVRKKLIEENL